MDTSIAVDFSWSWTEVQCFLIARLPEQSLSTHTEEWTNDIFWFHTLELVFHSFKHPQFPISLNNLTNFVKLRVRCTIYRQRVFAWITGVFPDCIFECTETAISMVCVVLLLWLFILHTVSYPNLVTLTSKSSTCQFWNTYFFRWHKYGIILVWFWIVVTKPFKILFILLVYCGSYPG